MEIVLVVAVVWVALAMLVGVFVARVVRQRDRQVPPPADDTSG